ncbi:L-aminoadipate-semialdehyde dehydrogenase [Diaporthe helianthi]|uniref:L-aminoadipate-semialdehyde dehydrogenase n=1 Tax=Diaporthe helianthi TaxID=158607 RepID=A0A2P5HIF7_DIAHE|nr:L-aminoadipate-semialdehyde dehydrogenase [Diaporthe helianthi]
MGMSASKMTLAEYIRSNQSSRSTPCVLVTSPEAVTERLFLSDLENASNRAATFLEQQLPKDSTAFFYMGPSDMRYFIWVMFPSPGNTVPANQRLFKTVGAKTLLYAPEATQSLASLLDASRSEVKSVETPSYSELMSKEPAAIVHILSKPFEDIKDVPVVGLHTSGTSGHPKPIYWTHGSIAAMASHSDSYGVYPESFKAGGSTSLLQDVFAPGEVVMMPFPLYHMGGLSPVFFSVLYGNTHVMPVTGTKMTPENITGMLESSKATTAWLAPSLLEDMLEYPHGLDTLGTMKHVVFGGGPMNPTKGDKIAKHVRHLCGFIGSTEGGACHLVSPPDSSHWNEFNFIDVGQKMEEVEPGLFELVYPKTELTLRCQLHFHSYPELSEYRTKDLFSPVPGKDGWWTYRGRTDNWVVMANALKMDPTNIESIVGSHPDVRGVLVAGDRRYRLCLLVEMKGNVVPETDTERKDTLAKLWPFIEAANQTSPKFGRIPPELVFFATREKPFLRASKGTIQRRLTIDDHADEINELYAKAENGLLNSALPYLENLERDSLADLLQYLYTDVLQLDNGIGLDDDLLAVGIDSFAAMAVASRLKATLRQHGVSEDNLSVASVKALFSASTIRSLADSLAGALSGSGKDIVSDGGLGHDGSEILAFIQKYKAAVQQLFEDGKVNEKKQGVSDHAEGQTVLLTGSTGSLGSYLLHDLLARPDIKQVICLNRGSDSQARQAKSLETRGLPPLLQDPKNKDRVVFLQADLSNDTLGLSSDDYAFVTRETTIIVHNAYPVNFLLNIAQFEPHLRGLLNLMALALNASASLFFVSSISTAMSATGRRQRVPEVVLDTATQVDDLLPQGYAQSKYVCEHMLEAFATSLAARPAPPPGAAPSSVGVLRVGQICGPRYGRGPWNKWEWFPSLVMSSRFLGVAPDDIGQDINWIPVDELACIVTELIFHVHRATVPGDAQIQKSNPLEVFNVVNPKISSWKEVLPALQTEVPETIPFRQWVRRLEESVENSTYVLDQNPGAKLVAFYQGALVDDGRAEPLYEVERLVKASRTAAGLGPVTQADLKRWMEVWL